MLILLTKELTEEKHVKDLIDKDANISTPFNTDGMIRGSITSNKDLSVEVY